MRILILVSAPLLATSALAAELPIEGIYGDELGCSRLVADPNAIDEPGGINVDAGGIQGYEWGCTWAEVWPYQGDRGYGVQGLCGGEGIPFLEQYIIEFNRDGPSPRMTVYAADGQPRWELNLCDGAPPDNGGSKG